MNLSVTTAFAIILLCTSCSPIFVSYFISSSNNSLEDSVYLNKKQQLVKVNLKQGHYPDKKVKNNLRIILKNLSRDTLYFARPSLLITSKENTIDTSRIKGMELNSNKDYLLPNDNVNLYLSYWSNTFTGQFKEFMDLFKREEIELFVFYKVNNILLIDSITLKPELKSELKK